MPHKAIGILTSGGDCPGLNAAIRSVGKAARNYFGMEVIGFQDGFRGLVENRSVRLEGEILSGIITLGGTILGTSRDKPHRMPVGSSSYVDMTDVAVDNYKKHHLDSLICLGGGGTQKNAHRLMERGLNIITLPKTIDNDVAETDISFGFDTAMTTAAEAIDRLHSTADSHHRVMVVEIMGHNAGWLALGAGLAGGADVILIPEIPYDLASITEALVQRNRSGKRFSIVAAAEGALSIEEAEGPAVDGTCRKKPKGKKDKDSKTPSGELPGHTRATSVQLATRLQEVTGLEARVTALGHLQRGGTPTPADRILATEFGTKAAELAKEGVSGVMVAVKGQDYVPVPLGEVAGKCRSVPLDHPWIRSARMVGTNLGD
jgi:phosphofructokinase-like protein